MKKGKNDYRREPFVRMGRDIILKSDAWHSFHARSRDFYILLKSKYNGSNNGQLALYYSEICAKKITGLSSHKGVSAAILELEQAGWIERTKIGGLHRWKNTYRLTGKEDRLL